MTTIAKLIVGTVIYLEISIKKKSKYWYKKEAKKIKSDNISSFCGTNNFFADSTEAKVNHQLFIPFSFIPENRFTKDKGNKKMSKRFFGCLSKI